MKIYRLKSLVIKESLEIVRDPSTILIAFVLPIILVIIFGAGISLDIKHIKLGLVLENQDIRTRDFAQNLYDSPYFSIITSSNRKPLIDKMVSGEIRGIVIIPSFFMREQKRGNVPPVIEIIADGSEPNTANLLQNYVKNAWFIWQLQSEHTQTPIALPLVRLDPRTWFNSELISRNYLIPGSIAIIMTIIGTLLTAMVISREWERGTMEALMSTPVTISEIIFGKLLPYFILGILAMIVCVFTAIVFFKVPFRGSFILLLLVTSVFLCNALGLGLLISTLAKNQFIAAQAALISGFLPSMMLSGFLFEINSMPFFIQILTFFIPAKYFVTCLTCLFLAGNVYSVLIKNILFMMLIASIIFIVLTRITRKRLE